MASLDVEIGTALEWYKASTDALDLFLKNGTGQEGDRISAFHKVSTDDYELLRVAEGGDDTDDNMRFLALVFHAVFSKMGEHISPLSKTMHYPNNLSVQDINGI